MESTSFLLEKKQTDYLFQYLNITVISLFLAISLTLFIFTNYLAVNDQIVSWFSINLIILLLRVLSHVFYRRAKTINQPLNWAYLFILGSCLNGAVISLIIFLIPPDAVLLHNYVLLLLSVILIASITSLGIIRRAFFTYMITISIPLVIFYASESQNISSYHVLGYLIVFIFTSITVVRFNRSLTAAFTMEIENNTLRQKLDLETDTRLEAENELLNKAQELQNLNENLENRIKDKTNELETLAFYDTLTQLPNRHHFYNYLDRTVARNRVNKEPFALFFIDLDEFKNINDTLGHDFGDHVLIEVGKRLRDSTRVDDFIARISGDEFIIILKGVPSEKELAQIAENIIHNVSRPYSINDTQTFLSCSIGVALYPQDAENTHTLVKYSDLAMYHAKENGKNSFMFYNQSLYEQKAKKFILANELKTAIDRNELHLVYQPQVHSQTGKITSMEVLLRWHSKRFGPVPVFKFISLAEESKLILELEEFVLKSALTQVKFWNQVAETPFTVGINISAVHFQQKSFVEEIEDLLTELEINPEILELELTESAIMKNTEECIEKLTHLKSLGISISIDDFGTGYSSMSYLKQLPIDILKIDKSFIDGIPADKDNTAIVQAIIMLAQQFNLDIIAEGVENEQQLAFLKQAGCHFIQGYYYYKPMTAEEFELEFNLAAPTDLNS